MKTLFPFLGALMLRHVFAAWLLALLAGLGLMFAGVSDELEQRLGDLRASMFEKPASGQLVLIEIDARSLQAIDSWPWPREHYAKAIEKLTDAGAAQIAFDVDFSARSTDKQDRLFADAIANSEATVILPTMRQRASSVQSAFVESLPLAMLRQNAFLASVNVHPDERGQLNQYSYGTKTAGMARPSLASMIAEVSGSIDRSFAIDQSIAPATIPRISFVDLVNGKAPPAGMAGKKALIGATAIELGDRYPISRFGVIPGVVIQAMASETLLQGTSMQNLGAIPALLLSGLILLLCILTREISFRWMIGIASATALGLVGLLLVMEYFYLFTFSIVPALFFISVYVALQKFVTTTAALETSQYVNEMSRLPNEAALLRTIAGAEFTYIATARLSDFHEVLVVTDKESRRDLFHNLASRFNFLARDERLFHLESDMVAWIVKSEYTDDVAAHFATANALLQAPLMAGDTRIKIGATFGISAESVDDAKIASEQAFAAGRKWTWHDDEVDHAIGKKQNMLVELDQAIQDGNLSVVYQPKWDLSSNRLDGAEALVRWSHPELGMVSPEIFIPMLEKAGRIDDLTIFVLRRALNDLTCWERHRSGLTCSVNISANLLGDSSFVEMAISMVESSSVRNEQIVFEVTETATLADPDQSVAALNLIQNTGIRVSIDDYGTGQSTMSYLQRLPISEIKLDQSFVKTMITDSANRVMVKSTIKMAHALGFKIVAEGIEDQRCFDLLTKYGCDIGQGWYISKPVASDVFTSVWLDSDADERRLSA